MKQAIAILRKDLKHLWPYAAAMVALLAMHGWIDLQMHRSYLSVVNTFFMFPLEPVLVLVAVWGLAGLAVLQERLPGDRQYWLTRPISRGALLLAKILLLVVLVCVPNFLAQTIVLAVAGFSPAAWFGLLLWNQVLLASGLLLALSLAAVMRSFRQYALISVMLFAAMSFYLSQIVQDPWGGVEWVREAASGLVTTVAAIAVLAVQYTNRRTRLAQVILASGLIAALFAMSPAGWRLAFALTSAISGREPASSVAIAFDPSLTPEVLSATDQVDFKPTFLRVAIPVRITGIPPGHELISERVSADVQAPGVAEWNSGWLSMNLVAPRGEWSSADEWLTHDGAYWLSFNIPGPYFQKIKDKPANLGLAVAFTMVTSPAVTILPPDPRMYPVAGAGHCSVAVVQNRRMFGCVTPFERKVAIDFGVQPADGGVEWRADGCCMQSYGPVPVSAKFSVWSDTGLISTGSARLAPGDRISVEVRRPVAFFQREVTLEKFILGKYPPRFESGR